MKKRDLITAAAGALAATALAGGIAVAAIPSAGGVIDACYQKDEGMLRVIDHETTACRPSEVPISWNHSGPQGIQGPPGQNGASGEDGAPGRDGRDGIDGNDGADGVSVTSATEPAGSNCANGGARFTAADGVTFACHGARGEPGPQGPQGTAGTSDTTVVTTTATVTGGTFATVLAACPTARPNVLGGGYSLEDSVGNLADVTQTRPLGDETGWVVRVRNATQNSFDVTAWAVCG